MCVIDGTIEHFIIFIKSLLYSWIQKKKYSETEFNTLVNYIQFWLLFWLKTNKASIDF